jgi:PKHD-type hydroxylase
MSSANKFLQQQRNNVNHLNYYYYTNAFTPEELQKIIEIGEKYPKQPGTTVSTNQSEGVSEYRISEISWLPKNEETAWIHDKFSDYAIMANKEMWNFDIWGFGDNLQYTKYYGDGGHYDWHVDLGPGISNRKLSCVLQLSTPEEYEGGQLQINPGGNILEVPKGLGTMVFFPSFLLHRVTPLTSGVRKSMVTWFCGANLR